MMRPSLNFVRSGNVCCGRVEVVVGYLHVEAIFKITQVMFVAAFDVFDSPAEETPGSSQWIILLFLLVVIVIASIATG